MLQAHQESFVRDVAAPGTRAPTGVEVLDGLARELTPAVWALGVQCSILRLPADVTPRERRLVEAIDRTLQRIARVLAGMHDLVLAEKEGGLPLDPGPADMAVICQEAVDQLRDAGIHGEIACDGDGDGEGVWDAERLSQALSYLLECALDAGAGEEEPAVRLRWTGGPRAVVVVVERGDAGDAGGSGMDLEWGAVAGAGPEGGVKAAVARRIVLGHGGVLARFAAPRTVAYVAVLPRGAGDEEEGRGLGAAGEEELDA